ncbi:hypothetical protein CFRS1_v002132 [Colletotrichum fructicola]|nr:hypothetical protein CFRS1_v002132 [Colletotrichum fructicola]
MKTANSNFQHSGQLGDKLRDYCNLQPRRASQLTHYTCILRCPIIADMTESQPNSLATSRTIQFLDLVALAAMCRLFRTEALDLDKPSATS